MTTSKYEGIDGCNRCPNCFANYRHEHHTCDGIMKGLVSNMKKVDPEGYEEMLEQHKSK